MANENNKIMTINIQYTQLRYYSTEQHCKFW